MFHDPTYVPLAYPLKPGWKGDLIQYEIDRQHGLTRARLEAAAKLEPASRLVATPEPEELPAWPFCRR